MVDSLDTVFATKVAPTGADVTGFALGDEERHILPDSGFAAIRAMCRPVVAPYVNDVYHQLPAQQTIWLLLIYGKGARDTVPAHVLRAIREEIMNG